MVEVGREELMKRLATGLLYAAIAGVLATIIILVGWAIANLAAALTGQWGLIGFGIFIILMISMCGFLAGLSE